MWSTHLDPLFAPCAQQIAQKQFPACFLDGQKRVFGVKQFMDGYKKLDVFKLREW